MGVGNKNKVNYLPGVGSAIVTTPEEIEEHPLTLKKGTLVYNSTTKEFKIADGVSSLDHLNDHLHPFTHAPLIHSHMQGANDPWLMSNPRLWYIDDLTNHPELVQLDGSELTDTQSQYLSEVYSGSKLATEKLTTETNNGFENTAMILNTVSYTGLFSPANLCNDEIDETNIYKVTDQWLSTFSSLDSNIILQYTFKNSVSYRPTEYWLMPANGTTDAIFATRPTPKNWTFEGSADGSTWVVLDQHTDEAASSWNPLTIRSFSIDTTAKYTHFRLHITAWNVGQQTGMEVGLRRFWIFGRKNGVFALPNVESENPAFAWVVPYKNLNIGLHHEDVGDIGTTDILPKHLPAYRLPTDGRSISQSTYSLLYAAIGHTNDIIYKPTALTMSGTSLTDSSYSSASGVCHWIDGTTSTSPTIYVDFVPDSGSIVLGKYILDCSGYTTPSEWIIEGYNESSASWVTIQHMTDVTTDDFEEADNTFFIDAAQADITVSKIRLNILAWNGSGSVGGKLTMFTHVADEFYIPTITNASGLTTYIVSDINATDVSSDIIQRLQNNIITLAQTVAALQTQINDLHPDLQS